MKLVQLVTGLSPKLGANKDFEEKRISGMEKDVLDREIVRELKQGWLIKARSHDSEGSHGVTLYRRRGPRLVGGQTPAFTAMTMAITAELDTPETLTESEFFAKA